MSQIRLISCPAGHDLKNIEDVLYSMTRDRKLWTVSCDHPECSWSVAGQSMMEVISKWNCRSLTDSIWESLWVPVEKGLPEPPTACLVLLRMGNNDPEGLETVASWEHGAWHIYDQDLLHLPVTHYIPLSSDGMVNGVAA